MKVSIRPAPHSKTCAISDRRSSCGKFQNQSERCAKECPAGYCCEMKHCWEVGEKLRDILLSRGHQVMMADKKYRKGSTESIASDNTKKAMKELMAWKPDVHIAIHTNASDNPESHGIRIGYPPQRYGSVQERLDASKRLAECVVAESKKIYWHPGWVSSTNGYNFYELNVPTCPAIYIEGCFANSNVKDARWWHDNMDAIAKSYADALEAWWMGEGHALPGIQPEPQPETPAPQPEEKPEEKPEAIARLKTSYIWKFNLWSDPEKSRSLARIKHGIDIKLLSLTPENGFYPAEYEGQRGYVDKRYIKIITTTDAEKKYLRMKPKYIWKLSLWDDLNMNVALATIRHGVPMEMLESDVISGAYSGYYCVRYEGLVGYVDRRYVERVT